MTQSDYLFICTEWLKREGYGEVEAKTEDAVIAADRDGGRVCFRCILTGWGRVGEMEVEELIPLMRHYGADAGGILTNGRFTVGAKLRAKQEGNITLIPRCPAKAGRKEHFRRKDFRDVL